MLPLSRMSVQQDGPLDPHKQPQWSQLPPPYAYQWTCDLCKGTFGTLAQRERHQQECPAKNAQQPQFSTAVSSGPGYAPRPEGAEALPKLSHPPAQMPHFQRMPVATRPHPPAGKRRVVLHWVKERPTLDLEVSYIDEHEGGLLLKWSPQDEWYQCEAALSLGQHSGCLTLDRTDTILPIKSFFVEQGGPAPQKIVISTGHSRVASRVSPAVAPVAAARETERAAGDRGRALERELGRLTADLDSATRELAEERARHKATLEECKRENGELAQRAERLLRENSRLRAAEPRAEFPVELEELRLQLGAWERRLAEMEGEAERARADKQAANDYSDYLHGQKRLLEAQLLKLRGGLEESLAENAKLAVRIQELSAETGSSPPPLPTRSKPVLKGPQESEK